MTTNQFIKFGRLLTVFAIVLGGISAGIAAESPSATAISNVIESVDYSAVPGGNVVVKVMLKEPLKQLPAAFIISSPPRLAIDFRNTTNALKQKSGKIGDGLLQSFTTAQTEDRTRIVLQLSSIPKYTTSIEGKALLIKLQKTTDGPMSESNVTHFGADGIEGHKGGLKNIDFQRGRNGEGRIVVDMEDAGDGIDIRQDGGNLVVDFLNADLPENLERRLNVVGFATPVVTVDAFKKGNNARLVIEPKGKWEHAAYQTDKRFVVEVKTKIEAENLKKSFNGEKLSLDFNRIDLRSLLKIIGDFTKKNVVVSDGIDGTMTLSLKDVPWDEALDIILRQKNIGLEKVGETLIFAKKDELTRLREQDKADSKLKEDVAPLLTKIYHPANQQAIDLVALITGQKTVTQAVASSEGTKQLSEKLKGGSLLSSRGSATVDTVTNTLFVTDIQTALDEIDKFLKEIDIPARQVLIEARIVQADESFSKSLGAKFGIVKSDFLSGTKPKSPGGADTLTTSGNLNNNYTIVREGNTFTPNDLNVNLPAKSVTGAAVSAIAMTLFRLPAGFLLNLELSASEADGKTKTISSPRVISTNNSPARFDFGEEIPYQQSTSSGATSVSFKQATLGVRVTPHITPDDKVNMDIEVTNNSRGRDTIAGPAINTNSLTTKVVVSNGETAVLGGFYKETKKDSNERVPFFSALPVVGPLFRSNSRDDSKQEILFFITPKVLSESLQLK